MEGDDCYRIVRISSNVIESIGENSRIVTLAIWANPLLFIPRDRIADLIRSQLNLSSSDLTLAQVLEGATWKGGREIAKLKRPETGGPPIEIDSDGTIF